MSSYNLSVRSLTAKSTDEAPDTRVNFKKYLAQNPNYFGNFPDAGFDPVDEFCCNTDFEALTCIGYNQILGYLQGTIAIKQPVGYLGNLCTDGSDEWVRFYVDYGDGNGFQDLGQAGVNVHDILNADDCYKDSQKPLYYSVTLNFTLEVSEQKLCTTPVLPNIRGILSWNVPPPQDSPDWVPAYGNVLNQNIQIPPRLFVLLDLINLIPEDDVNKLPPQVTNSPNTSIALPAPATVALGTLASAYGKKVAASRFGFSALYASLTSSASQKGLLDYHNTWSSLNLNFASALKELEGLSGSTQYEQLDCLGLEYSLSRLVATFHIKLPYGFSGTLCTAGSTEYVTFWSDWDNTCEWTLLGTMSVNVHDIPGIPSDGLAYAAVLPVDLQSVIGNCQQPKIARVRAVLSWAVPSSTTDPNAPPYYGNVLDAHVQLPPGTPPIGPYIQAIGGIATPQISGNGMTVSNAKFLFGGTLADTFGNGRPCPFGQNIIFQSPTPPGAVGANYRIWAQPVSPNPPPPIFLTTSFQTYNFNTLEYEYHTPDPGTGWLPYLNNQVENLDNILGVFPSSDNQCWQFQLETQAGPKSPQYSIQLDNLAPSVSVATTSPGTCGDLPAGGTLKGIFTATDLNFSHWQLSIEPPQYLSSVNVLTPSYGTEEVPQFPSTSPGTFTMSTEDMPACGYVVKIQAWDLSILNSQSGLGNGNAWTQGFCLTAPVSDDSSNHKNGWEVVEEEEDERQ